MMHKQIKKLCYTLVLILTALTTFHHNAYATGVDKIMKAEKTQWLGTTRPLTEGDLKGRLILLDFWTYGCINCMHVIPDLDFLEKKYGDQLLVIGVHSAKFKHEQGNESIMKAADRFKLHHPIINDADFAIWRSFGVRAWPTLVLLDEQGQELVRYSGEGHREDLDNAIAKHLKKVTLTPKAEKISEIIQRSEKVQALSFPARLEYAATSPWGEVFLIADSGHNRILAINLSGKVQAIIGSGEQGLQDGSFSEARFNHPRGMKLVGDSLYVADTENHALRQVNLKEQTVERIAGNGNRGSRIWQFALSNKATELASPWDLELMADGETLAIAMAGHHQLWSYNTKSEKLAVLAGSGLENIYDGDARRSALAQPSGLSQVNGNLYFADTEVSGLRVLTPQGEVKTLIGTGLFDFGHVDGTYPQALLQHPQGVFADKKAIFVADTYNNAIRIYDLSDKKLSTIQTDANLEEPGDVILHEGALYVANTNQNTIVKIDVKTGKSSLVDIQF